MKLSYFPQIKVVHTSKTFHGQLYVPVVNWLLMIGTVLVAGIYNNTTSLGNAYGVCVMFVTFFDSCMVTLVAILVWRIKPYYVLLPWLAIALLDGTYLSSSLTKVPDGAWLTLLLACLLACIFILWRFGKETQWFAEAEDRFPTTHFVKTNEDGGLQLTEMYGAKTLSSIEGFGIFFDKAGETTPIVFSQFIRKLVSAPEVIVFFHLRPLEVPFVAADQRYHVTRLAIPNCYRLVVRHGYMDEVITPDLASLIYEKVRNHIISRALDREGEKVTVATGTSPGNLEGINNVSKLSSKTAVTTESATIADASSTFVDSEPKQSSTPSSASSTTSRLTVLERAFNHEVLYIIGKEQMRVRPSPNFLRRALLHTFLFLRDNTRPKIASLKVPQDKVIEVGFIKDV
jgi:KUP system potassium uptake protein